MRHASTRLNFFHDAFSAKAARTQEKQRDGPSGRERVLCFGAVSKNNGVSPWQENTATTVVPPAEAKVIRRPFWRQRVCKTASRSLCVHLRTRVEAEVLREVPWM